jgi:hypothetical protein
LNAPRKPDVCDRAGAEKKEGRGEEVAEEICEEPFVAATVFSSQDRYGYVARQALPVLYDDEVVGWCEGE